MCGIFGVSVTQCSDLSPTALRATVDHLFRLSESRGKEAAGLAILTEEAIHVYKEAVAASTMIRRRQYTELFDRTLNAASYAGPTLNHYATIIGHSRLVTTGAQHNHLNNQPVLNSGAVGVHNGIIVNDHALWRTFPTMQRHAQVDSEVILGLIRHFLGHSRSLSQALTETFNLLQGAASIAVLFNDLDHLVLATNNGSLYTCHSPQAKVFVFASERHILHSLIKKRPINKALADCEILQLPPRHACLVNVHDLSNQTLTLDQRPNGHPPTPPNAPARRLVNIKPPECRPPTQARPSGARHRILTSTLHSLPVPAQSAIDLLRRCKKCILPQTMPLIHFDDNGICNYCHSFKRLTFRGIDALRQALRPTGTSRQRPDSLVGLSGGRDSTYGLHYIKTALNMNPIAFTYDWGMITDLARRNISRICGKLGVEHILVSADIEKKRRFIRKNLLAWLKKPDLGMIPLFMAGDKQYFYYAKKLKKQAAVPWIILCENMLERTDFKAGFSGLEPANTDDDHVYTISLLNKLKLAAYYGRQYLSNPAYLNASVPDTLFAYACYYLISRDYLNLYRYIEWDERQVNSVLIDEYDWELATDTKSTWRIGDGTAAFYNYIYYTVAGFTENDTFRSNQIRQGALNRTEALELIARDNQPRWETIQWYLDTVGLGNDFEDIISTINSVPKLYPV